MVCAVAIAGTAGASMSSFAADCPIPGNLRVVIGSTSTGGDTYQNSSIVADHLAKKLDINAKVDAVGAMAGFRALDRSRNGNTVMIFHDQAYLGNLYGVKGYDNIFEKYTVGPTVAINPGNAYLVPKDSPYQNIDEVIAAAGEGEEIRVAIQPGGVSEIGFSALKNAVKVEHPGMEDNVVAVNTGSQADKNQLLFDDMADVINGSVQANEQYTRLPADDQKAMRFVWLTARNDTIKQTNEEGMGKTSREDLLQYVNPNVTVPQSESQNFTFDKEFFFLYNKDMNPEIVSCIDNALEEIYAQGDIQEQQKKSFFIPNFKPSSEAQAYLKDKRDQYKTIIENIK
ncbi:MULTISPECIES: ABC transporter substrate-binding protein [unclassified Halomonas]|uniref:ABC transporter substrate-binding protein n=1 Tax=unclassified Halomonas TaxID=2609666 RepID=UPI001EF4B8B6|nr:MULTISPECIES: ABC transporter substrate-binding protein [unclassified Halomonas]MCP1341057.1 ABC transporter substrate-binding protein [Halomonas sp. FL8]